MTNTKIKSIPRNRDTLAIENEATPSFKSKTKNRKIGLAKWFVKGIKHQLYIGTIQSSHSKSATYCNSTKDLIPYEHITHIEETQF